VLLKYIAFLNDNLGWPPTRKLLRELSANKKLSVDAAKQISDALAKYGETMNVAAAGPGFADE
jgi:hypothetical protein